MRRGAALLIAAVAAWAMAANAAAAELGEQRFAPGVYAHFEFGAPAQRAPMFTLAHAPDLPPQLALRATPWTIAAPRATGDADSGSSTTTWIVVGVAVVVAGVVIIASSHHGGGGGNGY